ncbi:hypothetical protein Dimus_017191 [Dionaea muscipula]
MLTLPYRFRARVSIARSFTSTLTTIRCSSSMEASTADDRRRHRVVVCGGGVIGVCAAYFLSKKGAAVTLVEQSSVACAASGKAGGFLALDWCDGGPLSSLARASFDLHRSLAEELDGPRSYGYRALDALGLTVMESESQKTGPTGSRGPRVPSWVDGQARNLKTIGSTRTTAQVHPQLFTRTLMAAAEEKHGVEVVIGRAVGVEVVGPGGRVGSLVLEGGRVIDADSVVLALGPWSSKMELLSSLFRVYGLKVHSIVLEPKEADAITPHALFLSYYPAHGGKPMDPEVYPRPTGEVYICGASTEAEVPNDPEHVLPNPESIEILKQVAGKVSTHLAVGVGEGEAQVKAEQACFLPCTDDGVPVIGELPGIGGCFVGTGHSCWGILNGPATGAALAELVLDGHSSIVDLCPFSPSRFVVAKRH